MSRSLSTRPSSSLTSPLLSPTPHDCWHEEHPLAVHTPASPPNLLRSEKDAIILPLNEILVFFWQEGKRTGWAARAYTEEGWPPRDFDNFHEANFPQKSSAGNTRRHVWPDQPLATELFGGNLLSQSVLCVSLTSGVLSSYLPTNLPCPARQKPVTLNEKRRSERLG